MILDKARKSVGEAVLRGEVAKTGLLSARKERRESKSRYLSCVESQRILQGCAVLIQEKVHDKVAKVVSRCLEAVFDEPYDFRIGFEQKRGKTEARLFFCRDGVEVDPLTASGGGVVDVAAFGLRIACLMLGKPRVRKLVVLDEPFKYLSSEYRGNVRGMIESLSKEFGVQFIMVTHFEDLEIGKVVRL